MKVSYLHVLIVPLFVFVNPLLGGGTDRVVNDIMGGGATIYHSDGTTSRYNANPFGGGGTMYHSGGRTDRVVDDIMGGGATIHHSDGTTSRYNANPFGGGGTMYHSGGRTDRVVNDIMGGGATIHHSDGTTSRYNANPFGGGGTMYHSGGRTDRVVDDIMGGDATIHHSDGTTSRYNANPFGGGGTMYHSGSASGMYSSSPSYSGLSYSAPSHSRPSSYGRPTYGAPSYSVPSHSRPTSYSPPVIEGYRQIGSDGPYGGSSLGESTAAAAVQTAASLAQMGLQAWQDAQKPHDVAVKPAKKTWKDQTVGKLSVFSPFIEEVVIPGSRWLLLILFIVFVLYLPHRLLDAVFGRPCGELRDEGGNLIGVKMPKSIILPLIVLYVLVLMPLIFDVCIFTISFDGHFRNAVRAEFLALFAMCALGLVLPLGLQHGNKLALLAVSLICYVVSIGAGAALYMGGLNWIGCAISIMMIVFSQLMVGMLFLRQSREWFRAKQELSIRNRGQARCLVSHFLTEASHRTVRFVSKWYLYLAAIIVLISFYIIYQGLFGP